MVSLVFQATSSKSAKKWSLGQEYGGMDSAEKRRKELPQVSHQLNTNAVLMLPLLCIYRGVYIGRPADMPGRPGSINQHGR
jgi:hypothetical protein